MVGRLTVHMHRWALILAASAAFAVAGCTAQSSSNDSSGKFKGEQRLVANAAEHGGSCEKAVDGALKDTDSFGLTVDSVSISGNQATARVTADRGKKDVKR